ncbi:hypothetical protein WR25_03666 [Diploscapter pachys]|uniref:Uncharacterized protein n=1 Tax=Diploscapter pachys TaxID=2018661 RepID=A0A2A2JYG1_9BILA|nr:hypothetical protein WR25_03666 [Diploscapter pachys]
MVYFAGGVGEPPSATPDLVRGPPGRRGMAGGAGRPLAAEWTPDQHHLARRTVTLLGHDHLGQAIDALHVARPFCVIFEHLGLVAFHRALGLALRGVIILTEHEPHHVCVLLDRSRFAKRLQSTRNLGDFLHAVLFAALAAAGQQLEIVDDDQADLVVVAALQAPHARVQRADRQAAGIVDEQGQLFELGCCGGELAELRLADLAHAQRFGTDLRLFGQNTRRQLVGAHFQAEEHDLRADRFAWRDAVLHTRGDARQVAAAVQRTLGHLDRHRRRLREGLGGVFRAAVARDLVQFLLGQLDLRARIDLLGRIHRTFDERPADLHQRAQHREVIDLRRELARTDQAGARSGQAGEIGRTAQLLHPLIRFEHGPERDGGCQHVVDPQSLDRGEDAAVDGFVEMRGFQPVDQVVGQPVVDHHRAQHRGFGFDVAGQLQGFGGGRRGRKC